jgi:cellulose synthase/poly-beta-1,6-N-acetylglucosamine synthase-like glycosyltransferase
MEGGTGFMMFKKKALETFREAYPQMSYKPDHVRTQHFDGSREIHAFFDAIIDDKQLNMVPELTKFFEQTPDATPEQVLEFVKDCKKGLDREEYSNRYLSEDYMFCQWANRAGLGIWLCPWMHLQHMGSFVFGGSLQDLATIGVPATADPKKVGKNKSM